LHHRLPRELILEVPVSVYHAVVRLQVPKERPVVKHTVHCSIETMDTRVFLVQLGPRQRFPKLHFTLRWVCPWRFGQDPGMGTLRVRSYTDIGFKAETKEKIAKQHSVIL